jgi:hypothetical protein
MAGHMAKKNNVSCPEEIRYNCNRAWLRTDEDLGKLRIITADFAGRTNSTCTYAYFYYSCTESSPHLLLPECLNLSTSTNVQLPMHQ